LVNAHYERATEREQKAASRRRAVNNSIGASVRQTLSLGNQINVANHAGVVHLSMTLALCNFLPQIWSAAYRHRIAQLISAFGIAPNVRIFHRTAELGRLGIR